MKAIPDYAKNDDTYRASWIVNNIIKKALQRNGPFPGQMDDVVKKTHDVVGGTAAFFNKMGRQLFLQALNEYKFSANDRQREEYGNILAVAGARFIDPPKARDLIIAGFTKYDAGRIGDALKQAGY